MAVLSLSAVRDAYHSSIIHAKSYMYWYRPCWCLLLLLVSIRKRAGSNAYCFFVLLLISVGEIQLTNSYTMDELRFWRGIVWKVRVPSYRLMKRFTSGSSQLRLLKCAFTDVFGRGSDYGFLLCRSDGTIFFVFEERERARKKVNDSKYDERMSDLGVTAREWEHNI